MLCCFQLCTDPCTYSKHDLATWGQYWFAIYCSLRFIVMNIRTTSLRFSYWHAFNAFQMSPCYGSIWNYCITQRVHRSLSAGKICGSSQFRAESQPVPFYQHHSFRTVSVHSLIMSISSLYRPFLRDKFLLLRNLINISLLI